MLGAVHAGTKWNKGMHGSVRLLHAGKSPNGPANSYLTGIHIILDPEWKTYWRMPGDSGIPPIV